MLDSTMLIPILGLVVIGGFLIALMLIAKNYIKVSPNEAAVISGRTRKLADGTVVGYRVVRGGATATVHALETLLREGRPEFTERPWTPHRYRTKL